jgi:hypothetical protein
MGIAFRRFENTNSFESSEQSIVRFKFIPQMRLGSVPIAEIKFDVFCRHELVPILMALQHLYVNCPQVLDEICALIEADITRQPSPKLGCTGLTYWEILVLSALRLGANLDYDQLSDLATCHKKVRQMMDISNWEDKRYPKSTVHDNLSSLSAETIQNISGLIVAEGHRLLPKAIEKVRSDSYVLKKNIHYPTDANLLLDGIRKIIALCAAMAELVPLPGWRQHTHQFTKARRFKRRIDKVARSQTKDKERALQGCYRQLIDHGQMIVARALDSYEQVKALNALAPARVRRLNEALASELQYFLGATEYMADLATRRMIAQETIAHEEKVFSLFEPDTELINRGKSPQPIEFGHRVLIVEDSAGFIVHARVMEPGQTDEKTPVALMTELQSRFHGKIKAASFDKGFWSPSNLQDLSAIVPLAVLPKKGKRAAADAEREGSKEFGRLRKWHAGVESAIHALQAGNGLSVCRDKGIEGYQRYLALGVLGRNLQRLGTIFLEKERQRRREQMLMMAA